MNGSLPSTLPRRMAAAPPSARRRRSRGGLVLASGLIALGLLLPLIIVAVQAGASGLSEVDRVLFRQRSAYLLQHTVTLAAIVTALACVIGVAGAWATERTGLPARRVWTVLLVAPVAIPDFVVGFAWHSMAPRMNSLLAATIVMTLGTYPLVYLPVMATLRRADPALEDTARSLGLGRAATFLRVSLPLMRTAVLGGCLLVVLTVLSEYGAFEIVRYQTFTTEIFTEFQFAPQAAGALSIPLVLLCLLLLVIDGTIPRRRVATVATRRTSYSPMRWRAVPVCAALGALVMLGVGVPIGALVYWIAQSQHTTLPAAATLGSATWATVRYSGLGAALAVGLAVPVAMMTFRRSSPVRGLIERSTYLTQAAPGVVIALSLVFFTTRYVFSLYHTALLLVIAYAILHFPLALVCVKASVAHAPAGLTDVGKSLGRGSAAVFLRVTLPLLAPGLLAGFCLVFLTAVTELTATLVLAPIGVQTLATQFWAFQSEVAYGAAAPYALVIIALAMVPGAMLGLWFGRRPEGAAAAER